MQLPKIPLSFDGRGVTQKSDTKLGCLITGCWGLVTPVPICSNASGNTVADHPTKNTLYSDLQMKKRIFLATV